MARVVWTAASAASSPDGGGRGLRRLDELLAAGHVAAHPPHRRPPGQHLGLLGGIGAVEPGRGVHLLGLVEAATEVEDDPPLAGEARRRGVAQRAGLGVRGERGVPVPVQVVQVAVELGDAGIGPGPFGDPERLGQRVRSAEPVDAVDGLEDAAWRVSDHRPVVHSSRAFSRSPRAIMASTARCRTVASGHGLAAAEELAAEEGRPVAVGRVGIGFEEDAAFAERGQVGDEIVPVEVAQQGGRHVGQVGGEGEHLLLRSGQARQDLVGEVLEQAWRPERAAGRPPPSGRAGRRGGSPRPPAAPPAASRRSPARSRRSSRCRPRRARAGARPRG